MVWEQHLHQVNYACANSLQCHTQWFLKWFQFDNWATAWQNQQNDVCAHRRFRSAWASEQSDQSQRCPPEAKLGPKLPIERKRRLWSDWADAQADLSRRWAQKSFVGFVMRWLKMLLLRVYICNTYTFHHIFIFRIEPNMKPFSHANDIVLRRGIYKYIYSLNWCLTDQTFSVLQMHHGVQ